jgi:hypothetical protein
MTTRRYCRIRFAVAVVIAAAIALHCERTAHAGMLDTPIPTFSDGKPAELVGLVPAVVKNNGIETVFICTNLGNEAVNIGVEIFSADGTVENSVADNNGVVRDLAVGATATIATSGTATLSEDERISSLPQIRNGSGRIVATNSTIGCIAFLIDENHPIEDPLVSEVPPPTFLPSPVWICGNTSVDPLEECDAGTVEWERGTGCRSDCTRIACGDPDDSAATTAPDALFALQASVGLAQCDSCVCDVDSSGGITAVDALRILNLAVGLSTDIQCTRCS